MTGQCIGLNSGPSVLSVLGEGGVRWGPGAKEPSPQGLGKRERERPVAEATPWAPLELPNAAGAMLVSNQDARQASASLLARGVSGLLGKVSGIDSRVATPDASSEVGEMTLQGVLMMAQTYVSSLFGAEQKSLGNCIDGQSEISKKLATSREQKIIDQAVKQQKEAKKTGIASLVGDWIMAAVDEVAGAVELVAGVAGANPLLIISGAAFCSAGAMGFAKAALETKAFADGDPNESKGAIHALGIAQMSCEWVGIASGVVVGVSGAFSEARTAGNAVMEQAKNNIEMDNMVAGTSLQGAEETVEQAAERAAKQAAEQVASVSVEDTTESIMRQLGDSQMTAEQVEKILRSVLREGPENMESLASKVRTKIARMGLRRPQVTGYCVVAHGATKGSLQAASAITQGKAASLQCEIDGISAKIELNRTYGNGIRSNIRSEQQLLNDNATKFASSQEMTVRSLGNLFRTQRLMATNT